MWSSVIWSNGVESSKGFHCKGADLILFFSRDIGKSALEFDALKWTPENWSVISAVSGESVKIIDGFRKKFTPIAKMNLPRVCGMETGPKDKLRRPLWDAS